MHITPISYNTKAQSSKQTSSNQSFGVYLKHISEMSDSAAFILGKEKACKFFELLDKTKNKITKIYTSDYENPTTSILKDINKTITIESTLMNGETGNSVFSFRSNVSAKENFKNFVLHIKKSITELEKNKNYINRKTMEVAEKVEESYNPPRHYNGSRTIK